MELAWHDEAPGLDMGAAELIFEHKEPLCEVRGKLPQRLPVRLGACLEEPCPGEPGLRGRREPRIGADKREIAL